MANKITKTEINPVNSKLVVAVSRYAQSKVVYYGDKNLITFKTYKKQVILSDTEDQFTVVPPGMDFRPDRMSSDAYGLPDFWWKILEANNLKDIYEFRAGLNIRLPAKVY